MATLWSAWTPDVAIHVPGCPDVMIEDAVRRTAIDFYERTHWLQRTATPITVTGGAGARTFASPVVGTGECVLRVLKAWLNDDELEIFGPLDVEGEWPDWQTRTGDPECIVMQDSLTYYVVPSPTTAMPDALWLKVAVGLLPTATGCDDELRLFWRDAIMHGALARLLMVPGKLWTSPQGAAIYQADYLFAAKSATIRTIRGPANRPLAVKPHFF